MGGGGGQWLVVTNDWCIMLVSKRIIVIKDTADNCVCFHYVHDDVNMCRLSFYMYIKNFKHLDFMKLLLSEMNLEARNMKTSFLCTLCSVLNSSCGCMFNL